LADRGASNETGFAHPSASSVPVPNPSWRDAVAHARAQIDAALSLVAHVSAGTVYIGGSDRGSDRHE
jgi:hypothetical protein